MKGAIIVTMAQNIIANLKSKSDGDIIVKFLGWTKMYLIQNCSLLQMQKLMSVSIQNKYII